MKWNSTALSFATIGVVWLIVGVTVLSEQSESFKTLLASLGGHHWVGKSIVAASAFVLLYFLMRRIRETRNPLMLMLVVSASIAAGGVIIFLFYIAHYLGS